MTYIDIEKYQDIMLVSKEGSTPTQAIISAIEFCTEHETSRCILNYSGFYFTIHANSDVNSLIAGYRDIVIKNQNKSD